MVVGHQILKMFEVAHLSGKVGVLFMDIAGLVLRLSANELGNSQKLLVKCSDVPTAVETTKIVRSISVGRKTLIYTQHLYRRKIQTVF